MVCWQTAKCEDNYKMLFHHASVQVEMCLYVTRIIIKSGECRKRLVQYLSQSWW